MFITDTCNGCFLTYKPFLAMGEEDVFAFLQRHGVVLKNKARNIVFQYEGPG